MTEEMMALHNEKSIPPASLRLRSGMCVMLLRNLNVARGLCNGSRLIVLQHSRRELLVRVTKGPRGESEYASIPRIWLESDVESSVYQFKRLQIPVRPCFAMTISKSQGQSLKVVGIDMRVDPFLHGQTMLHFLGRLMSTGFTFFSQTAQQGKSKMSYIQISIVFRHRKEHSFCQYQSIYLFPIQHRL